MGATCKFDDGIVRTFLRSMKMKVHLRTEDVDPSDNSVEVSANGSWKFWGQKYSFSAYIIDTEGDITGQIEIEGLGFLSEDELTEGSFDSDAAKWIQSCGITFSKADAIRMVVAG